MLLDEVVELAGQNAGGECLELVSGVDERIAVWVLAVTNGDIPVRQLGHLDTVTCGAERALGPGTNHVEIVHLHEDFSLFDRPPPWRCWYQRTRSAGFLSLPPSIYFGESVDCAKGQSKEDTGDGSNDNTAQQT